MTMELWLRPVFLSALLSLPAAALAEEHFVTPAGGGDGSSAATPWSLNELNDPDSWDAEVDSDNGKIGPGDTVYFDGHFTEGITVQGSGTPEHPITLDGLFDGENDLHDYFCDGCARVTLQQLINRIGINLEDKHYIVVQDFELEEMNTAIRMAEGSTYLWVKRNIIHHMLDDGMIIHEASNLVVGGARGDGNHFYDCGSGTGAADVVSSNADYVVVSYNWLEGGPDDDRGIDGVTLNSYSNNYLIEFNLIENHNDIVGAAPEPYTGGDHHGLEGRGEDATDVKHQCHDVVIRGNVLRGHYFQGGLHVHGRGYNVYVYGNYISNNAQGILVFNNSNDFTETEEPSRNIHVWANIFEGNYGPAVSFSRSQEGGSVPREPHHLFVYNNVFAKNVIEDDPFDDANVSSVTSPVMWFAGRSSERGDRNNIFYLSRPDEAPYHHEVFRYDDWKSFDEDPTCVHGHNTYFDPRGPSNFRWYTSGSEYTSRSLDWVQSNTNLAEESYDRDPGMANPEQHEFWPASEDSNMVASGTPLSDESLPGRMCFLEDESICVDLSYAVGLGPGTDWSTTPPTVVFAQRSAGAWDRGAYVFGVEPPCECELDNAIAVCDDSACVIESCVDGYADCNATHGDGCEVELATDSGHCGSCEVECLPEQQCSGGSCTCAPPLGECEGVCVDLDSDIDHCGDCATACGAADHADAICSAGVCQLVCHAEWRDGNRDLADGCEEPVTTRAGETVTGGCSCRGHPLVGLWLCVVSVVVFATSRRRRAGSTAR